MQYDPPDWRCRLPGPLGARYYKRWKQAKRDLALARFDAAMDAMPAGALCIDLGANIGNASIKMAERGARVLAFEPDPDTYQELLRRTSGHKGIEVRNEAVGETSGTAQLFRAKGYEEDKARKSLGSSLARSDPFAMDRFNTVSVQVTAFSDLLAEVDDPIHVLKVDVEGSEWPILRDLAEGLGRGRIRHVFAETHERFAPSRLMPEVLRLERSFRRSRDPEVTIFWP